MFLSNLQKCILWHEMLGKGQHEWMKGCTNANICTQNLNTLMKTR
jgi:hypothetical protein